MGQERTFHQNQNLLILVDFYNLDLLYKYILFIKIMLILYQTKLDFIAYSNKKQFF
jgi:hypothetical protein